MENKEKIETTEEVVETPEVAEEEVSDSPVGEDTI